MKSISLLRRAPYRALTLALCLGVLGTPALAISWTESSTPTVTDEIKRHWGDSFESSSTSVRLEYHVEREYRDGSSRHEWLVAVVDPRQVGQVAQWFQQAGSTLGGSLDSGASWNESKNHDWADRFRTRWGHHEGRPHGGGGPQSWWNEHMNAVPEPSSWALMLLGVLGMGLTAKRRKR